MYIYPKSNFLVELNKLNHSPVMPIRIIEIVWSASIFLMKQIFEHLSIFVEGFRTSQTVSTYTIMIFDHK